MIQKEEYRKTVDGQHASEELIQKTLQRISQEPSSDKTSFDEGVEKTKSVRFHGGLWGMAAAAVILLFVGASVLFKPQNICYSEVTPKTVIGGGSLTLGQVGVQEAKDTENLTEGLEYTFFKNETYLPDGILEGKTNTIEKKEVYFGESQTELFAAFSDKEGWGLFSSKTLSKKEFEQAVKKELQKKE